MSKLEGISVKLPLTYSQEEGPYKLNKTLGDVVKQNFKNLILTIPGERVMIPDFGVGLYRILFEPMNSVTYQDISAKVYKQTSKYMPFIDIESIRFDTHDQDSSLDMNQVKVIIQYNIGSLNARDVLQITATST
tara:strand:- start:10688 stop:11089 length:402 start_codon:yes stop_codon:yes gene_type:complete